jgi:hypothetical protein
VVVLRLQANLPSGRQHNGAAAVLSAIAAVHGNAAWEPRSPGPNASERPIAVGVFAGFENVAVDRAAGTDDDDAPLIDFEGFNALLEPWNRAQRPLQCPTLLTR